MLNDKSQNGCVKKDMVNIISYENVIHDMKLPLSIIHTTVQFLENMGGLPNDAKEHLRIAKNSCYRIMKLMNDVNDFAKIDNGYFYPTLRNYNVVSLVRDITESTLLFANRKNINLDFKTNTNEKIMGIDKEMLERILLNLLSNAIKFTYEGGKVEIIFVDKGDTVEFIVKDNGIGIDLEKVNNIFKRYTTTDSKLGSGLGLSIVNELTRLLGGNVLVKKGESMTGSQFVVELPVIITKENGSKKYFDNFYSDNIVQIELSDYYY